MKKLIDIYSQIITESEFKNKKWVETGKFLQIIIKENKFHLAERLKTRYQINFESWVDWIFIKKLIIKYLIDKNIWIKCSKKNPYQKGFTVHLTVSNMWLSGILQNDLEDGEKRIYFSTFLPEEPHFNPADYYFELPI